jgi:predicted permease
MKNIWKDVCYGLRAMGQSPGFAAIAVITLALGIGANTAIFSLVDGMLLRPLPYAQPDHLVRLVQSNRKLGLASWGLSHADFLTYSGQSRSFESIAAYANGGVNLTGDGEPERLSAANVTADFFKVLGLRPAIGREFRAGEDQDGRNNVCIISNGFWLRHFGRDPKVVGKVLMLSDAAVEIVGVAPAGFQFPSPETEIWRPIALNPASFHHYSNIAIGRLKTGVDPSQAQTETSGILRNFGRQHPDLGEGAGVDEPIGAATIVTPLKDAIVGKTEKPLLILLASVGMVLLIACANVANLLMARATSRTREIAVRFALGATPSRVVQQLMTESLLFSAIGAATGIGLAWGGLSRLNRLPLAGIPRVDQVTLSGSVLAFTAVLAVLTGLLFGLLPAIRAYKMGLATGMREGGRGSTSSRRFNSGLVAFQFALSLVLLIGAGLLLKSFERLQSAALGFDANSVLAMTVALPSTQPSAEFYQTLSDRMQQVPGVKAAGIMTNLPFANDGSEDGFLIEGRDNPAGTNFEHEQAEYLAMMPHTLQTLGVALLAGRDFQETDTAASPAVAIIDVTLARRYFPQGDALGKRVESSGDRNWMTIVGIAGGVKHRSLAEEVMPHIYSPLRQGNPQRAYLVIRADGAPSTIVSSVRAAVRELNPNVPVYQIRSMSEMVEQTLTSQRLTNLLLTSFSALALLLAAVGIYGTMSLFVGYRMSEFGVRLALGARPAQLVVSVLKDGFLLTAAGIALGLAAAYALTRTLTSLLFEVSATDPTIFISLPLMLIAVAMAACYVPARRASKADAIVALRSE